MRFIVARICLPLDLFVWILDRPLCRRRCLLCQGSRRILDRPLDSSVREVGGFWIYDEIKIIYAPQIVLKGINDGIRHFSPASIDNDALVQCWPRSTSTMCLLQVWMATSGWQPLLPALTLGTSGSICADCQPHPRGAKLGPRQRGTCLEPCRHSQCSF